MKFVFNARENMYNIFRGPDSRRQPLPAGGKSQIVVEAGGESSRANSADRAGADAPDTAPRCSFSVGPRHAGVGAGELGSSRLP